MNEELIKDVMRLDYSQLVMNCVGNIEEIERLRKDIEFFKKYERIVNTIELHCLNASEYQILIHFTFINFLRNLFHFPSSSTRIAIFFS